jgi:exonuclease III
VIDHRITGVDLANDSDLCDFRPRTLTTVPLVPCDARTSSRTNDASLNLPTVFMTNAQSLVNKFDEVSVIFYQYNVDIAVITESWFRSTISDHQLNIGGYNLFSNYRNHKRGGGVAVYVRHDIPSSNIVDIVVPDQLECEWVMIRPKRLPRSISAIAVCAVYITTKSPHQELLTDHLVQSVDYLRAKHPDIGIIITGDFNRMNIYNITRGNDLFQTVTFNTRKNAILDLLITNSKLKEQYKKPFGLSPTGYSDHKCVVWQPNVVTSRKKYC